MKVRYEIAWTNRQNVRCFANFITKRTALKFANALIECTTIYLDTYARGGLMGDDLIASHRIVSVKGTCPSK